MKADSCLIVGACRGGSMEMKHRNGNYLVDAIEVNASCHAADLQRAALMRNNIQGSQVVKQEATSGGSLRIAPLACEPLAMEPLLPN